MIILDQLEGVPDSIRHGKVGFTCFCALCLAGLLAMFFAGQPDQYCFAPPVHNWVSKAVDWCLIVVAASSAVGFVALFIDRRRLFGALALGLFFPVVIAVALAKGCW